MYEVVMPKLGLTMDSGTLLRWWVEEGSQVEKDEPLFEVQTDKVAQEVTVPVSGTLRGISLQPDEEAPVGTVIAYVVEPGETFTPPAGPEEPAAAPAVEAAATRAPAAPEPAGDGERVKASPAARRAAREHGVDLAQVEGSGPGGRIKTQDVLAYVASQKAQPPAGVTAPAAEDELIAPPQIHQVMARRMSQSFRDAPHFYLTAEVDARRLIELRSSLVAAIEEQAGVRPTLSNLGMFGVDLFQAIVNPPEGAILAVGAVRERAVVEKGQVVARPTFYMTLSMDHRVTDGANAARFLHGLKDALEAPYALLLPG